MSWKQTETIQQIRTEFISDFNLQIHSFAELCRRYGISRKTGYKWVKRHKEGCPMTDRSRRHLSCKTKTSDDIIGKIMALRQAHPTLGGHKISIMLKRKGVEGVPSGNTVTNILRGHGMLNKDAIARSKHLIRFACELPNVMWQADFKGCLVLRTGEQCKPLNIIDDCSRFCLCSAPLLREDTDSVREVFRSVLRQYGQPLSLLCDNGNPWGVQQKQGLTG